MKLVINTNVILVSISPKSKYHWIFQNLVSGHFDLLVSNDILLEYQEIVTRKFSGKAAAYLLDALDSLPNVCRISPHYFWNLITNDSDDNKFADCAISGNADHLITEDNDFQVLKTIEFPKISVLNISEFRKLWK